MSKSLCSRKRLEMSADGRNENFYDDPLDEVVKKVQKAHGITPDGIVGAGTRRILNQNGRAQEAANLAKQRLILLNMERWRWLPHTLGPFYVNVNVPEFMARVVKEDGQPCDPSGCGQARQADADLLR